MSKKITVPIKNYDFPYQMPDKCVYCGKPKDSTVEFYQSIEERKNNKVIKHELKIQLPYCEEHARIARRNKTVATILGIIAMAIGAVCAVLMWVMVSKNGMFGVKEGGLLVFLIIIGAAGGAFVGFQVSFFIFKILVLLIGPLVTRTPFEFPAGFSVEFKEKDMTLDLKFKNEGVAGRFSQINEERLGKKEEAIPVA